MIPGGKANAQMSSNSWGINISSGVYGKTVKLVYGLCQVAADLVWYNGWSRLSTGSNVSLLRNVTGQTSGKKNSKKNSGPYYSARLNFLLGHAPMRGVFSAWWNNQKLGVFKASASGVISGGSFTFAIGAGDSKVVISQTVPAVGPYTFTPPNFVADRRVRIDSSTNDNLYLQRSNPAFAPGPMEYTVNPATGLYTFNAAQAGVAMRVTYFKTTTATGGILAGIVAVTVHEEFTASFNDYGAPGAVTEYGTWERPLWNSTFGVPGRVDSGAFRARDPYTFAWDGVNPTVTFPAALNGLPVTVYYGTPAILSASAMGGGGGGYIVSAITPLQLLNLEFEQSLGSGAEYALFPDQQIIQDWCAGLGSTSFDLGASNSLPNLLFETIGAFTLWPNGDCDVADIVADIVASGPVLV